MAAGIQELLLLIIIVLAIVLLPRMTAMGKSQARQSPLRHLALPDYTGRQRLAIVLSLLWPAAMVLCLSPWKHGWERFIIIGIGPLVLSWSTAWVIAGYKHRRKK